MRDDHPIDELLVFVEDEVDEALADRIKDMVDGMAQVREWVISPPEFVDESDEHGVRTVGFTLSLYTALPPWRDRIDPAVDRAHLDEVKLVAREASRLSREHDLTIGFELAGVSVGWIESGNMDELLAVGLIGEWERILNG